MVMLINIRACTGHKSLHTYRQCMKPSLNESREGKLQFGAIQTPRTSKHRKHQHTKNRPKTREKHVPLRRKRSKPKGSSKILGGQLIAPTGAEGIKGRGNGSLEGRGKKEEDGGKMERMERRDLERSGKTFLVPIFASHPHWPIRGCCPLVMTWQVLAQKHSQYKGAEIHGAFALESKTETLIRLSAGARALCRRLYAQHFS